MKTDHARARVDFLVWMKNFSPEGYDVLMESNGGLGAADKGGFWANLTSSFKEVLPVITQSIAQAKIFKAQMKRAKRGLPPLKTEQYAPTVRIQADIAPETRNAIIGEARGFMKSLIMPAAGIGLIVVMFIMMRRK